MADSVKMEALIVRSGPDGGLPTLPFFMLGSCLNNSLVSIARYGAQTPGVFLSVLVM